MATAPLARLAASPDRLASIVETAALAGGEDPHDEMFVRVTPTGVDTPASAPDAEQVSYCTAGAARFDEVRLLEGEAARALFRVEPTLAWLDWLEGRHDRVTATLEGAHGVATRFVFAAGDAEEAVPCSTDWDRETLSEEVVERFAGARFLDEDGDPVPTRIETDAAELRRLVEAARLAGCTTDVPFVVADGDLVVDIEDERACVDARLDARVEGPDCRNRYGHGLVRVATALSGDVTLQTGPGRSLAVVKDRELYTLRYVVRPLSRLD